jgi:flotillin
MPEILQNPAVLIALIGIVGVILLLLTLVSFFRRYYNRASSDEGLIRTGSGGQKVVIDGGIWVFPILHEISKVSLRTIRKEIRREGRHDSLITQDNIRVNIVVEFYIKVQADQESVLNAARSLGKQMVDEKSISELMEGKLTDALRSVAANKKFLELHQQRQDFAGEILKELNAVIHKNGFTLESVSITNLNQTPLADLDEHDYFDSQGARAIVEIVEKARQDRNKIELESKTIVAQKNFDEEKKNLAIKEQQSRAQAETARRVVEMQKAEAVASERNLFDLSQKLLEEKKLKEVETQKKIYELEQTLSEEFARKKAETDRGILLHQQATETAQFEKYATVQASKEQAERLAMVAGIDREKQLEAAQIDRQKAIETARIDKEQALQTAEIAKQRAVDTALIETEKSVEAAKVDKVKAIEQANLDREVTIVQKLEEKAAADAKRLVAIALKEEAEQKVITVQETAAADRQRAVTIIQSEEQAKKETINAEAKAQVMLAQARSEAESQRLSAEGKANYDIILAKGLADAVRIKAEADAASSAMQAQAIRDLAIAGLEKGRAEAETRRLSVVAENSVSNALLMQRTTDNFIQQIPSMLHELMKPAEAIKEIKILQVSGLTQGGTDGAPSIFGAMNPVLKSMFDAGAAMPIIKELYNFAKQSETVQKYIPKDLEKKFHQLISDEQSQEDKPAAE